MLWMYVISVRPTIVVVVEFSHGSNCSMSKIVGSGVCVVVVSVVIIGIVVVGGGRSVDSVVFELLLEVVDLVL